MPRHAILDTCLHIFLSNQRIGQFNLMLIEPTVSSWFGKATQFLRFELLTTLVKIWLMPMLIDAVTIATITLNSCSPASNPQTDTCSSILGERGLRRAMSCWVRGQKQLYRIFVTTSSRNDPAFWSFTETS